MQPWGSDILYPISCLLFGHHWVPPPLQITISVFLGTCCGNQHCHSYRGRGAVLSGRNNIDFDFKNLCAEKKNLCADKTLQRLLEIAKTVISIFYGMHLVPHFSDNSVCVCVCVCV